MKKLIILSLAGLLVAGSFAPAAFAAGGDASTDASIRFTENTGTTDPLDPLDPDLNGQEPGTGMSGSLTLDYVPTLEFGDRELNGQLETFNVITATPYIQVSDKRGTGNEWKVTVRVDEFKNQDATKVFPGTLTFTNPSVVKPSVNESAEPVAVPHVSIISNGPETQIVAAHVAGSMGTWLTRWLPASEVINDSIQLTVNTANIYVDNYTANLTWTLSDAP